MKSITVSAPGKIHLLGEHVVVYGKPTLLAALDKRCFVTITARKEKIITIVSKNLNKSKKISEKEILAQTKKAQAQWLQFNKTNDISLLQSLTANPLDYAIICIGEALFYYDQQLRSSFELSINSEVTAGMGSSSSLSVAIVGAVSLFLGKKLDRATINEIAFRCEQKQHGSPSGGDNSVSTYGGLIWFRKETPDLKIMHPIAFSLSKEITKNFFLIDTGKPHESTGEMVSLVKTFVKNNPLAAEKIFTEQEFLVRSFLSALQENDAEQIISIIKRGERNLERLGVVSSYVKSLINKIEKLGGAAKICGGGGKKKKAGILLVYHQSKKIITNVLKSHELILEHVSLGIEGVRED